MSKIGQKTISVPAGVDVTIDKKNVVVKGNQEELTITLPRRIDAHLNNGIISLTRVNEEKKSKALHGLMRQLIYNAIVGMGKPWQKRLEVVGTGYNVKLQGEDLVFKLGFSHPVTFKKVPGIRFQVEGNNKVVVSGCDKQLVGQIAYQIKIIKKPDVYKGKGIRFEGEHLRIKPGKKAKAAGAAAA